MGGLALARPTTEGERPIYLLEGATPSCWEADASLPLGPFTLFVASDADQHSREVLVDLAHRMLSTGVAYMCAWGPGCERVHEAFDLAFVGSGTWRARSPFLMTTDHAQERLAEALWFALDLAYGEDVKEPSGSAVVIAVDRDEWRREILQWLDDLSGLRRHVVEDLP